MWLKVHLISGPGPQEHKLKLGIKCKRREAAISGTPCTADTWSWEWVQLGAWGALSTLKQLYRLFRMAMGRCTLAVEMWDCENGWEWLRMVENGARLVGGEWGRHLEWIWAERASLGRPEGRPLPPVGTVHCQCGARKCARHCARTVLRTVLTG